MSQFFYLVCMVSMCEVVECDEVYDSSVKKTELIPFYESLMVVIDFFGGVPRAAQGWPGVLKSVPPQNKLCDHVFRAR